jgi:DNA repair protein RadC
MEKLQSPISMFQVAEINIVYRPNFKVSERPVVSNSKQVCEIFRQSWDENKIELQEQFKIMLLNRASRVLGIYEVSSGGISGTLADPKLIFAAALKAGASSMIMVHNHPSGNLKPSEADFKLTTKIKEGGKLLDISVYDHLIITADGYFSFADEGFM